MAINQNRNTELKTVTARVVFALLSFLFSFLLFAILTHQIIFHQRETFDHAVFAFLSTRISNQLISVMRFFTLFGKPEFLIPAYLLLIAWFVLRRKKVYAWEVAIMGTSSTALLFGLKKLFGRKRPNNPIFEQVSGYSFPSGHALLTFVFCSVLVYLTWQSSLSEKLKWILSIFLVLFSLLVGISRIILRVHYPTDVIAGFAMGYSWVILGLWIQHKYITTRTLKSLSS